MNGAHQGRRRAWSTHGARRVFVVAVAAVAVGGVQRHGFGMDSDVPPEARSLDLTLSGELELARLVELVTQRLGVSVQYQAADLAKKVTIRLRGPIADAELWPILTSTLETQGLALVGAETPGLLRIVPLAQAATERSELVVIDRSDPTKRGALAGPRPDGSEPERPLARASFVSVLVQLQSADPFELAGALAPLLTPQSGVIKPLGTSGLVLISDARRRVEQALALIESLDGPADRATLFTVELSNSSAGDVAALTLQALAAKSAADARSPRGTPVGAQPTGAPPSAGAEGAVRLIALPDDERLLVAAPGSRERELRELIAAFDAPSPIETMSYSVPSIAPEDLAASIRVSLESARQHGPSGAGSGGAARVVVDRLLGAVFVTATIRDHDRVRDLIERLEAVPSASRQTLRAYTVRNRTASDLVGTLERLLEAGAMGAPLDRDAPVGGGDGADGGPTDGPQPLATSQRGVSSAGVFVTPGADVTSSTAAAPRPWGESQRLPATSASAVNASLSSANRGVGLTLSVDEPTNTILALGEPGLLRQLEALILDLDKRQPQVLLEAILVSLSESDALSFGVELRGQFEKGGTTIDLASLFGLGAAGAGGPLAAGTGFTGAVLNPGDFQVLVRALETINHGRAVSSPKALVNNNATATLRGVLRQPFTSINASQTVATTSFGGTQDAGTTITVTPAIAEGDHLLLDYSVELSAFVGSPTTTVGGGIIPPPSQQNSVEGQATIPDSFTVAIGGLDNISETKGQSRVPILGSIPILGALFGTTNETESRSRFFVFLRATILRDAAFADLKQLSDTDRMAAELGDGSPLLEPLWID